jgi:hypothetical protein
MDDGSVLFFLAFRSPPDFGAAFLLYQRAIFRYLKQQHDSNRRLICLGR